MSMGVNRGAAGSPQGGATAPPLVETCYGKLAGSYEAGIECYRGIPFAAPPLGERRFCAPEPPEPWTGARDAIRYGMSCPQSARRLQILPTGAQNPLSEDCLTLNVWTPAADHGKRPVIVYIHGGAFRRGEGSSPLYAGTRLVPRGDLVLVTLNYRLGALGFMDLSSVGGASRGASANPGLLDQIAALEWVRDNIAAFGGDPANVTLCGESAGGMCIGSLMAMPRARGLFRRAILQSGAAHNYLTPDQAARVTSQLLEGLGVPGGSSDQDALDRLFGASPDELLAAQAHVDQRLMDALGTIWFQPVIDPATLPRAPLEAIQDGSARGVSLLIGTNLEEWNFFCLLDPTVQNLTEAGLLERVRDRVAEALGPALSPNLLYARAARIVEVYTKARSGASPAQLFSAIETDRVFRVPAIRLAEAQRAHAERVYKYLFTYRSPALDGRLGSCHALDLPFVFGHTQMEPLAGLIGAGAHVERLSEQMMDAWIRFAHDTDPGHPGLPEWRQYTPEERQTMLLGPDCEPASDPGREEREVWQSLL